MATSVAGLASQSIVNLGPARKDDDNFNRFNFRRPVFPQGLDRPYLASNPDKTGSTSSSSIFTSSPTQKDKKPDIPESNRVFFDGNVLNISLPVAPDEINDYGEVSDLENEVGDLVQSVLIESFQPDEPGLSIPDQPRLEVMLSESEDGSQLYINAKAKPAEEDKDGKNEIPKFATLSPNEGQPSVIPPFATLAPATTSNDDSNNQQQDDQNPVDQLFRPLPGIVRLPGPTDGTYVKFLPEDAITNSSPNNDNDGSENSNVVSRRPPLFIPKEIDPNEIPDSLLENLFNNPNSPPIYDDGDPGLTAFFDDSIPDSSADLAFDRRLNSILSGGSSANIVEATVVEDFDYARRVRESQDGSDISIGIATISSITIGLIALLIFGLLIFMAVARRRRRDAFLTPTTTATTPSQSRTTLSPPLGETPSVSTSYLDDLASGPASLEPSVLPIDGHQTIVASYNDFLSVGSPPKSSPIQSLPSLSEANVPKTQNLPDSDNYLFVPTGSTDSPV